MGSESVLMAFPDLSRFTRPHYSKITKGLMIPNVLSHACDLESTDLRGGGYAQCSASLRTILKNYFP